MQASLPMYNIPEMHPAFAAFWAALRDEATSRGVAGLPAGLRYDLPAVPDRIDADVIFTQVCGFPLLTRLKGQATILLTPVYDLPGCDGPMHTAFFIVRDDSPIRSIPDLRGKTIGINSLLSNTGMNLPRATIAPLAAGRPYFGRRVITGSHTASIEQVADGRIDVAAIDCVTDAVFRRHRPALMRRIRVLAETVQSPSLPFVTAAATPPETALRLRDSLQALVGSPAALGLSIRGFEALGEADYRLVLDHQDEAARLGYPELV
ncbi:MAG: PhnD/SsuA/transferrin family substrate-binding protein [Rhodospirillales bacterium]|nr:PhnD/SsuA/transferrin family substrate-binding protein [Rhodospirillales bacterium]